MRCQQLLQRLSRSLHRVLGHLQSLNPECELAQSRCGPHAMAGWAKCAIVRALPCCFVERVELQERFYVAVGTCFPCLLLANAPVEDAPELTKPSPELNGLSAVSWSVSPASRIRHFAMHCGTIGGIELHTFINSAVACLSLPFLVDVLFRLHEVEARRVLCACSLDATAVVSGVYVFLLLGPPKCLAVKHAQAICSTELTECCQSNHI